MKDNQTCTRGNAWNKPVKEARVWKDKKKETKTALDISTTRLNSKYLDCSATATDDLVFSLNPLSFSTGFLEKSQHFNN